MFDKPFSLLEVYTRAVREGMIAGALCSIWGMVLYLIGDEWYASPLMLIGIAILFAWILFRYQSLARKEEWLISPEHVFGFLFAAYAMGTFLHDWVTWLLLSKLDPALNEYLITKEMAAAKAYFKETRMPEKQIETSLEEVKLAADLSQVQTLMQNFVSELIIGLVVMGGFSFLFINKAQQTVEDIPSPKPILPVSKLPGRNAGSTRINN